MRARRALGAVMLASTTSLACAAQPSAKHAEQHGNVPGREACARLKTSLPLELGGLLLVIDDADPSAVERALAAFALKQTRIEACDARGVLVWVPGVENAGAATLEETLSKGLHGATIRERDLLPPERARRRDRTRQ